MNDASWSQTVEVQWRPDLGFFESRSELLRDLEERVSFEDFKWTVDDVTIRVGEYGALRVGVNGATATVASPRQEIADRVRKAMSASLRMLQPRDTVFAQSRIRQLVPISGAPTEEQRRSTAQLIRGVGPGAELLDFALLMDGSSDRLRSTFQVEFGVVSSDEVHHRYMVHSGRIEPLDLSIAPDLKGVPESAVFLDWVWTTRVQIEGDVADQVLSRWADTVGETNRLSLEICRLIVPDRMAEGTEEDV